MNGDLPSGLTPEDFSAWAFDAPGPRGGTGLELAPFRGVRFDTARVGDLAAVTSPPYDVIDGGDVRHLLTGDGHSVVRLILPEAAGGDHAAAARTLDRWREQGVLAADDAPALYVYEVADAGGVLQRGLVGALGLRAERERVVLPHENVYPGPVRDRLALMTATHANLEPIFLTYEGGAATARIVDDAATGTPIVEFHGPDGRTHRMWRVADPALHARIAAELAPRQALIADGHHRYATYRALQGRQSGPSPYDYGLALLVDSTRYPPHLGAIHRVLPALPLETALAGARDLFTVTPQPGLDAALDALDAAEQPSYVLGRGRSVFLLTPRDVTALDRAMPAGLSTRLRRMNTAVLDRLLIRDAWHVSEDEHTVDVVHDDAAAALDRAAATGGTAVVLRPLGVAEVHAVAAAGERVPRKSTSFGPKPRSGLVLRLLDLEVPGG
ncbi:DUF1015 domain-containing protein [Actinomadura flavalba]|uniref:DUF1015 domain-containing protein n=1 Tax=Actinomadura flavalba TaxID=1120938 RepID=UPI000375574C|nr:DUF1015 domain-containing protein [Actinomadura flavalba]